MLSSRSWERWSGSSRGCRGRGNAGAVYVGFFFSSRRRHTRFKCDWSSDVCSSDLALRDVGPGITQSIKDGVGSVLVGDVEASFTPLETSFKEGQRGRKLLFSRVVDKASMFVQTQSACQVGQTRKVGITVVAHLLLPGEPA